MHRLRCCQVSNLCTTLKTRDSNLAVFSSLSLCMTTLHSSAWVQSVLLPFVVFWGEGVKHTGCFTLKSVLLLMPFSVLGKMAGTFYPPPPPPRQTMPKCSKMAKFIRKRSFIRQRSFLRKIKRKKRNLLIAEYLFPAKKSAITWKVSNKHSIDENSLVAESKLDFINSE